MHFPDIIVRGTASSSPPVLTQDDLMEIRCRADMIDDPQVRNDLFRLIAELDRRTRQITHP